MGASPVWAPRLLQVVGVLAALFFGVVSLLPLMHNSGFGPNSDIQHRCVIHGPPNDGGPYNEATIVRGAALGFPLGLRCTYDSPIDDRGAQEVVRADWGMTAIWLGSGALAIGGLVLTMRATSELD